MARRAPPAPFSTSLFATQIIRILLLISPAPGFLAAYENERVEEVASAASLDEAAALDDGGASDEETASEDTDESSDGTESIYASAVASKEASEEGTHGGEMGYHT